MEPFNLKGEREEGYFDKTGNFVWRKEEGKADAWLGALDTEEDMEAMIGEAAAAKRKRSVLSHHACDTSQLHVVN